MRIDEKNRVVREINRGNTSKSRRRSLKRKLYRALMKKIREEIAKYGRSYILFESRYQSEEFVGHSARHGLESRTVSSWGFKVVEFSRISTTGIISINDGFKYYSRPITLGWSFMEPDKPELLAPSDKMFPLKRTVDYFEKQRRYKSLYSSLQTFLIVVGERGVKAQLKRYWDELGDNYRYGLQQNVIPA